MQKDEDFKCFLKSYEAKPYKIGNFSKRIRETNFSPILPAKINLPGETLTL